MTESSQGNLRPTEGKFRLGPLARLRAITAVVMAVEAVAALTCVGAGAAPGVRPPSAWVRPLSYMRPRGDEATDQPEDCRWLLSDRQINPQNDEQFYHEVRKPLTSTGVRYGARIMVNYDPGCQVLTFHWAKVQRGTNTLDRLDLSNMRISQAVPEAGQWLCGSERTAVVTLDDVQEGDIVDFAYSIEGSNPALEGKYCDAIMLQTGQPADRLVTRLVWPSTRRLYIKNHLTDIRPSILRKTNAVEYTWAVSNATALQMEPGTPIWYDPYPWVQLSEFPTWAEVNRWAQRLFTATNAASPDLARKINDWKQIPGEEAQVVAALQFVQDEIRTLDAGQAVANYAPAQPSVAFGRRAGENKDKALLLTTMLRALKIEAFPVLVHDHRRLGLMATRADHPRFSIKLSCRSTWTGEVTGLIRRRRTNEGRWRYAPGKIMDAVWRPRRA